MCGIAGIYNINGDQVSKEPIQEMLSSISQRGPDGSGIWVNNEVGLGHARLSIIDLSEAGRQPMQNENGTIFLVCNGEIYNYRELREQLEKKGHQFSSHSDSEVIIHLYEEYKNDHDKWINMLNGMFAFAIWDQVDQKLVLVRDRLGIKPLFYTNESSKIVFSSELTGITSIGNYKESDIDFTSVYEYLQFMVVPGPHTTIKSIKHLEPAHYLIASRNNVEIKRYWKLQPLVSGDSEEKLQNDFELLLEKVIDEHLIADVPVGVFLSAGVDSSVVSTLSSRKSNGSIFSITATFPGEDIDEGKEALNIARKLNTNHLELPTPSGLFKDFEEISEVLDMPMPLASALPLYKISIEARKHVKVVLTGDGGDEILGGYDKRYAPFYQSRWDKMIPDRIKKIISKFYPITGNKDSKLSKLLSSWSTDRAVQYFYRTKLSVVTPEIALNTIKELHRKEVDTQRYIKRLRKLFNESRHLDLLTQMMYVDIHTSLVDEMLFKVDRITMAAGIEARVPLLDHRIVEFAMCIPSVYKRNDNFGKLPLRKILSKYLGDEIAYRKKTGFNTPIKKWYLEDKSSREQFDRIKNSVEDINLFNDKDLDNNRDIDKMNLDWNVLFAKLHFKKIIN